MALPSPLRCALLLWPVGLLLAGCRDNHPAVYQIPKEKPVAAAEAVPPGASPHGRAPVATPAAASGDAAMAATAVATASGAELSWTAPAGWQAKAASSMRKGSFTLTDGTLTADLGITAFPGDVGGEFANVNRWRGQLGLAPLGQAEALAAITRIEANGLKFGLVDLSGTASGAPSRLLGAMVPFGGATWFFKLLGPDAVVAKERSAFVEFVKTVKPAQP